MEQESKKITKIVISSEDELTDVVTGILESPNERIVLTFAEESDLLISPINLKVIQEATDEQEKLLIAQIINNPTGVKNANSAGIGTIETTTLPLETDWEKELKRKEVRLSPKVDVSKEEPFTEISDDVERNLEDDIPVIEDDGISIDEDLPTEEENQKDIEVEMPAEEKKIRASFFGKKKMEEKVISTSTKDRFQKKGKKISPKAKRLLILISSSLFIILGLGAFVYYKTAPYVKIWMYIQSREASVEKIFTGDENIKEIDFDGERIPIKNEKIEKDRSSTIKATGTAFRGEKAKGTIMISYYPDATDCPGMEPKVLEAGHVVTSSGGKVFKIEKALTFSCEQIQPQSVGIEANEIGEGYNLAAATSFDVQGFSGTKMKGLSTQAIVGGTKEEYNVLSQADVNAGAEELKKIAFEEGERELKDKSGGSWEIIMDSLKSEIAKDSIKTDKAVGSEATEANLSLITFSSATFFMKDGFDEKISELLTKNAEEKNLFETDKNLELTLSDEVKLEISVVENNPTAPKIKLIAKASVKPKVEKQGVIDAIKGKKWDEGMSILNTFVFSEKKTEVQFEPPSFPESLKYFPTKRGGIVIEFKEVL